MKKFYIACGEEMAMKIESKTCVTAHDFSGSAGYIPLAANEQQALQLLFASKHAPHKAATEAGICLQMLALEMAQTKFDEMMATNMLKENANYNPPAYRMITEKVPLDMIT